jgi:AcrR family transcriptional regulator
MTAERGARGPGRPPAASRDAVERIALALMLRDGYDAVSVDAIASAANIGRTTFFRYFGSKPGVVWDPFDATIAGLRSAIEAATDDTKALDSVRMAIVSSTRSALYSSEVWLERFQLLDNHPSLHAEAYEHWETWKMVIAERVARDVGGSALDAIPMAVAGAFHGVFVAELRSSRNPDDDREAVLDRLDRSLAEVCVALRLLL